MCPSCVASLPLARAPAVPPFVHPVLHCHCSCRCCSRHQTRTCCAACCHSCLSQPPHYLLFVHCPCQWNHHPLAGAWKKAQPLLWLQQVLRSFRSLRRLVSLLLALPALVSPLSFTRHGKMNSAKEKCVLCVAYCVVCCVVCHQARVHAGCNELRSALTSLGCA